MLAQLASRLRARRGPAGEGGAGNGGAADGGPGEGEEGDGDEEARMLLLDDNCCVSNLTIANSQHIRR